MFFKKKKPKLDPKVRFQHKQFASKLQSARTYRRQIRAVPETSFDKFFAQIGLASRWSQILVGLILLGSLYLVYMPNFLSLQNIVISGLSESQARDLEIAIRNKIANQPFYNPQSNMLFLSTDLVSSASSDVVSVARIVSVQRNFSEQTLIIEAESKYEKLLVATPDKVYDVYNDGVLKGEAGVSRDDWGSVVNPNMAKLMLTHNIAGHTGQKFFQDNLYPKIVELLDLVKIIEGQQLAYLSLKEEQKVAEPVPLEASEPPDGAGPDQNPADPEQEPNSVPVETALAKPEIVTVDLPVNSSEIHAVFFKNNDKRKTFRVIFDATRDLSKSVTDLKLLLSQTSPDRYNQLDYIDMRLETKAFICLSGSPCNK